MCCVGNPWALAPYCNGILNVALVGGFLTPVILENMYCTLFEMCHKNPLHPPVPFCLPHEESRNNLAVSLPCVMCILE